MPKTKSNDTLIFDRWIISIGNILSLFFLVCTSIIILEIVLRYIFNSPTIWIHETTVFICSILFLYAGSFTLAKNKHIRITMLHDILPNKFKYIIDMFVLFINLIYSIIMLYAAYIIAQKSLFAPWGDFRMETSGSAWDPVFPALVKSFLFVALCLMFVQFLLKLIKYIKGAKNV